MPSPNWPVAKVTDVAYKLPISLSLLLKLPCWHSSGFWITIRKKSGQIGDKHAKVCQTLALDWLPLPVGLGYNWNVIPMSTKFTKFYQNFGFVCRTSDPRSESWDIVDDQTRLVSLVTCIAITEWCVFKCICFLQNITIIGMSSIFLCTECCN